jgi:hypothetical protein
MGNGCYGRALWVSLRVSREKVLLFSYLQQNLINTEYSVQGV